MNLLTKKEVAEKLKCSERTINRMMNDGLPKYKDGNLVRFDFEAVLEWLRKDDN